MIETTTRTCTRCRIVFPFCRVPHSCSQAVLDVCAGYCWLRVPVCCCSSGSIALLPAARPVFSTHHNCSCLIPSCTHYLHLAAAPYLDATVMHRVLCHCCLVSTFISTCPAKDTAFWPVWPTVLFQSPERQVRAVCILSIKLFYAETSPTSSFCHVVYLRLLGVGQMFADPLRKEAGSTLYGVEKWKVQAYRNTKDCMVRNAVYKLRNSTVWFDLIV